MDAVAQELLHAESPEDRHILLDVVAEVLLCYRYQNYHSAAALLYTRFVGERVSAKYGPLEDGRARAYEYRYFADESLASVRQPPSPSC